MNKFLAHLFSIVVELENVYEEVNKETKNKDSDLSIKGASEIVPIFKLNINKKIAFVVFKKTLLSYYIFKKKTICLIFQDINFRTNAICCSILPDLLNAN